MLPLIIPALCHLTADDALRPIVLQSPIMGRLFDYLTEWSASPQQLETCAGVFLNLAVLGAETLDSFTSLLDFCVQKAMVDTTHPVMLKANLALLGLFLLRSKLCRSRHVLVAARVLRSPIPELPLHSEAASHGMHRRRSVPCGAEMSRWPTRKTL
ncbi:hypothetical protein HPB50_003239 [Hyalomma asiaticum]|uniref:Uncharacterized protein n=1 Tax=Hyalomma asiaticum TaxID=266040 RepID=A0ACB7RQF2_HYAAI|nr:hypothetical protein HPB50_003239 [Hyalomma asiaticum]